MPLTDEQQMEIDMISAMYGDTFEMLGDEPPSYKVLIATSPEEAPELGVTVTYPVDYPESSGPAVLVENVGTRRRILTDKLSAELNRIAAENAGTLCATILVQRCQEFLVELDSAEAAASADKKEELVDPSIRMGTSVSREVFEEWAAKHREKKAIRRAAEAKAEEARHKTASKLTGRQLWDSTIKNADWALFGEEEGDVVDLDAAGYEFEAHDDEAVDEAQYEFEPEPNTD